MSQKYINPYFENYYSVEKLFETDNLDLMRPNPKLIEFKNIEEKQSLLIIGEPGIGKSELLNQYFDYLNEKNTPIAFLDLKTLKFLIKIKEMRDSFFENAIATILLKTDKIDGENKIRNDFNLEENVEQTFLLDGLDEVDGEYFEVVFKEIIQFKEKHQNIKILVSCRRNYVEKHQNLFFKTNFEAISILPFSYFQVGQYLAEYFSKFDNFHKEFKNSNLISLYHETYLNTPRYLKYFKELIKEKGFESVKQLGRHQIIEYIIYERIKVELEKLKTKRKKGSYNIEIIIQILEKIALIMKMQEDNVISKENFSQFFLDSSFNLHNEISLTQLQQNTILKDLDRHLQFDNTEFQEYLAAKQISRTSNYVQIFYDLIIDENLKEFKFNWFNVLSYLVEIKPNFILPIIKMGKRIDDKSLFKAIKFIKKDKIEDSIKSKIFHIILNYYNFNKTWMDYKIKDDLAELGKNEINSLIDEIKKNDKLNESNFVLVGNTCNIMSLLLKNKIASSKDFELIKEILFSYYDTKINNNDVVHRFATKCLIEILDRNEIEQLIKYKKLGESVSSEIVNGIAKKYPNELFSIELLINHIKSKSESNNIYLFNKINSSEGLIYILNYILKELKSNINYHESLIGQIGDRFNNENENILNNIRNNWNEEFEKVILDILYTATDSRKKHKLRGNNFLFKLFNILLDKTRIPIEKILSNISKLSSYKIETYFLFPKLSDDKNCEDILNYVLLNDPENVTLFLKNLSTLNNEIFLQLKVKQIKCVLKHEENEISFRKEAELNIIKKEKNDSQEKVKSFFLDLRNKQIHILYNYDYYKDDLKKTITKIQKSIIHNFIIENVFNILSVEDDFEYFERSLYILKDLEYDNIAESLNPYRKKLLKCIVFYEDFPYLKRILGNISINEIEKLKVFFLSINSSNYWKTKPFFDFLDKYSENFEKKILEDFIKNINPNSIYILENILTLYAKDFLDIKFLEEQFSNFKEIELKDEQDYNFLFSLNKVLVQNNSDFAINWLIENIKLNKYVFKKDPNSTNSIGGNLPQEDIGRNIGFIKSFKYSTQLLELIEYGMDLMAYNFDYYKYVDNEILGFFQVYCSKLELNEKEYLIFREKLNIIIETNREKFSYNFLKDRFENILFSLKNKTTKNKVNISGTIQKYEELQKKKYLDICYPKDVLDAIIEVLVEIKDEIVKGDYGYLFKDETDSKIEDFYEKFLMTQIELHLLRKGFRKNDVQEVSPKVYRQIQGVNDKRTDLLVSYGSIGTILIELKKEYNPLDLNYKETTLKNYMEFTYADFCICLVINDKENEISFDERIAKYKAELEDEIYSVIGLTFLTPQKNTKNTKTK